MFIPSVVAIARTDEREIETENTGPNCCIDKARLQVGPVGESNKKDILSG